MAESLLFGVAESFIGKLASRAVEEASLALGVYNELQDIKETVSLIKAVLLDAEQKQHHNNELREWLRQIKRVFYDAEDVIDDFECEALRKQVVNTSGSIRRKVRHFFSSSNPLIYRLRMAHEIKYIKERLDKVAAKRLNFGLQINDAGDNRFVHKRELTYSHVNDSDVIGREHDKKKIIDLLLKDGDDKSSLYVIPIVGIGGLGKTTLAKSVFNDTSLKESFSLKMWVCVTQDFDLKQVLVKILKSASEYAPQENFKNFDMEQLKNHLRNKLVGQKFLLVLDDVWNENRVKWVELKNLIQVGVQGSQVLVTTRSHTVANMMGTHSPHVLEGLSPKDSLSVFVKWAFKEGEEIKYPTLMEIGKDIVKKCGGLPLALRTLGSSLFLKVDITEWKNVRDNEIWNLPQNEDDILPAIKLSYDQLPSYLKQCFACFSLFEKNFEFTSIDVIELWEALGFLPSPKNGLTLQDVGKQLLLELHSRSFLHNFLDFSNIYSFQLHDLVHDFALYIARDEFQVMKSSNQSISSNVLHLSFIKNDFLDRISIPTNLRLRTIIFNPEATNEVFLNTLVSRYKYLRILGLLKSLYETLPRSVGKLKHLRCLDLEHNKELRRLPDSLCKLQNLQILKLTGCTKLEVLPSGIGNLINLRLLGITTKQCNFLHNEIAKLTSLEILGVSSCNNLELLFEGLQLTSLKFLSVYSCDSLKFVSLDALLNLESLYIDSCPKLELSMVHDNRIPKLNLKLLNLESLPQLVTFPQWMQGCAETLQTFGVVGCSQLYEFPDWFSTFICLKVLVIESCPKLLSLPDYVHCLPNLEFLYIRDCPELCTRYKRGVGCDWHKISHIKRVIIESSSEPDN